MHNDLILSASWKPMKPSKSCLQKGRLLVTTILLMSILIIELGLLRRQRPSYIHIHILKIQYHQNL